MAANRIKSEVSETKIPAMDTPIKKPSAADLMKKMAGIAVKPVADKGVKRPEITLNTKEQALAANYFKSNTIAEYFKTHKDALGDELKYQVLLDKYINAMWDGKSQPENPKLRIGDAEGPLLEGIFIVQEKMKVSVPNQGDLEPADAMMDYLVKGVGLKPEKAKALVENEINFEPPLDLPIGFLRNGGKIGGKFQNATLAMKSAAEKLLSLVAGAGIEFEPPVAGELYNPFTNEEQQAIQSALRTNGTFSVKQGFLERVINYVDSKEQLTAVLTVIKPTPMLKGGNFVESVTKEKQNQVLMDCVITLLKEKLGIKV